MNIYPKNFSPRKDVSYLFEDETKVEALKRKLYEKKPFESRFTEKLRTYAKDWSDTKKIETNLIKYIEAKHEIGNKLLVKSKVIEAPTNRVTRSKVRIAEQSRLTLDRDNVSPQVSAKILPQTIPIAPLKPLLATQKEQF